MPNFIKNGPIWSLIETFQNNMNEYANVHKWMNLNNEGTKHFLK